MMAAIEDQAKKIGTETNKFIRERNQVNKSYTTATSQFQSNKNRMTYTCNELKHHQKSYQELHNKIVSLKEKFAHFKSLYNFLEMNKVAWKNNTVSKQSSPTCKTIYQTLKFHSKISKLKNVLLFILLLKRKTN